MSISLLLVKRGPSMDDHSPFSFHFQLRSTRSQIIGDDNPSRPRARHLPLPPSLGVRYMRCDACHRYRYEFFDWGWCEQITSMLHRRRQVIHFFSFLFLLTTEARTCQIQLDGLQCNKCGCMDHGHRLGCIKNRSQNFYYRVYHCLPTGPVSHVLR